MASIDSAKLNQAFDDLAGGVRHWRIWFLLGLNEIRHRYRRSTIGPFWLTLSMGVQATVMGVLFGFLFQHDLERFLPYLCISLVLWNSIQSIVNEGSMAFISATGLIMQVKRPLSAYIYQVIWRNLLVSSHTIVIFFVVALIFGVYPSLTYVFFLPGLVLMLANVSWMALVAAILSARFRDVPMIIQNSFTVLFWLTPVLYMPSQMKGKMEYVILFNPFSHFLEVVRSPLMGAVPSAVNYSVPVVTAILGWTLAVFLFARARSRVPYWL